MKRINIVESPVDIGELLELAQEGPVLLVRADGQAFVVAPADDFDKEVAELRQSAAFQAFLDTRSSKQRPRRPLAEVAHEIEMELSTSHPSE